MSRTVQANIKPAHQERSRAKRDLLINAGLSVFSIQGYAQTRMVDIAAEAGVSVGVLYQRFKNKRAFFEVIVDTLAEKLEGDVNGFFNNADEISDLGELMERVVVTLAEMVERDVGFFLALITVGDEVPGAINRIAVVDRLRAVKLHAYITEHALINPSEVDEEKVFFALATAIRMLLVTATVDREPIHLQAPGTLRELAVMLTGYLKTPST